METLQGALLDILLCCNADLRTHFWPHRYHFTVTLDLGSVCLLDSVRVRSVSPTSY